MQMKATGLNKEETLFCYVYDKFQLVCLTAVFLIDVAHLHNAIQTKHMERTMQMLYSQANIGLCNTTSVSASL